MKIIETLKSAFSASALRDTRALEQALYWGLTDRALCRQTAEYLVEILDIMGLPVPQHEEILPGTEGALLFLNDEGIVFRIENNVGYTNHETPRLDDHPMVVQPLGTRDLCPRVRLEICPGCATTKNAELGIALREKTSDAGLRFWDYQLENIGLLPVKLPQYPDGVPVVIDRLAVDVLRTAVKPVGDALALLDLSEDPQKALYAELRDAFQTAWPEGERLPRRQEIRDFLALCRQKKAEGLLVDGWNSQPEKLASWLKAQSKTSMAAYAADKYAGKIKALDRK